MLHTSENDLNRAAARPVTTNSDDMLESLLEVLARANGQPGVLFELLLQRWPQARTTALISGLLLAEAALRDMFRESEERVGEGALALAAALAIAEAANQVELEIPGRFIRLSDIAAA